MLMDLIQAGQPVEPIETNEDLVIADGRHRRFAYEMMDVEEVEIQICSFESETEMIEYAFRANNRGGPKPPSPADIDHTIELLLERGETIKGICEGLGLPAKMIRKYIQAVKDRLASAKLQRAAMSVTDNGMTVAKAAEEYGVDQDDLKEILSGRRRRHKSNVVADLQRQLTFNYRSVSQKNAAALRRLSQQYDDGDVSAKQVQGFIEHLQDLQKQGTKAVNDWKHRFDAKFKGDKSVKVA